MIPPDIRVVQGQPTETEMVAIVVALETIKRSQSQEMPTLESESRWQMSTRLNQTVLPWVKSSSAWQISGLTSHSWPV